MELFYTTSIQGDLAIFGEEEARHISRAYRKRPGDALFFTDGKGWVYEGQITGTTKGEVQTRIVAKNERPKTWSGHLTLAFAPTKNFNRIEWLIERVVEMGVDRLIPLETTYSERKVWKMDRLQRIIIAGMKQSQKCVQPQLESPQDFQTFCQCLDTKTDYYFGHCEPGHKTAIGDLALYKAKVGFCVGPEGDFSKEEIAMALEKKMCPISLGHSRLRTETAAFKMTTAFQLQNDKE